MAGTVFAPDRFYRAIGDFFFPADKIVYPPPPYTERGLILLRREVVRCSEIRDRFRGKYAVLHLNRYASELILYLRLSSNRIGAGSWEELNEMEVLALADDLFSD